LIVNDIYFFYGYVFSYISGILNVVYIYRSYEIILSRLIYSVYLVFVESGPKIVELTSYRVIDFFYDSVHCCFVVVLTFVFYIRFAVFLREDDFDIACTGEIFYIKNKFRLLIVESDCRSQLFHSDVGKIFFDYAICTMSALQETFHIRSVSHELIEKRIIVFCQITFVASCVEI